MEIAQIQVISPKKEFDLDIVAKKHSNSSKKLSQLQNSLTNSPPVNDLPGLTIFATGSYARGEASVHSDIDLFFVNDATPEVTDPNIKRIRMISEIVDIGDSLEFPRFSNDGEYLDIIDKLDLLEHLGGRKDDYHNYFTARMLLLLESKCVHGKRNYDALLNEVLHSYLRDFPEHPKGFNPSFLINDIIRFWKTLCLNYEHRRNQRDKNLRNRTKQKTKNFKLKFSRMLTCFASVSYIVAHIEEVDVKLLSDMCEIAPRERLLRAVKQCRIDNSILATAMTEYDWFLRETDVSEQDLLRKFEDKTYKEEAFGRADKFSEGVFGAVREIADMKDYLRYLVA